MTTKDWAILVLLVVIVAHQFVINWYQDKLEEERKDRLRLLRWQDVERLAPHFDGEDV